MLQEFGGGLIHMAQGQPLNDRIYDPNLGRFMTADPHVQMADYSQSYNRYSYIMNNPFGGTDPSGFFNLFDPGGILPGGGGWFNPGSSQFQGLSGGLIGLAKNPFDNFHIYALERSLPGRATMDNFMLSHEWAMDLGHAALAFASAFCYAVAAACYAAMEAHVAGYTTWLAGGSHEDAFNNMAQAGAIAFVSAAGNYAIGQTFNINGVGVSSGTRVGNVLAHAAFGCAMAEAGGGKCGAGALSGAITAGVDQINTGSFGGGMALAMVAGCAGSAAGGGSCGRGAVSSALIYIYNNGGALLGARGGMAVGCFLGPFGCGAGAVLGAAGGFAAGVLIGNSLTTDKTPNNGDPRSWYTNPGSGQERLYGSDGKPDVDIDWDHSHGGSTRPHAHNWDRKPDGTPHRGPPQDMSPLPRGRTSP